METPKSGSTYKKRYKMNAVGKDGLTTTVAIPPEVIDRKAEEEGITPEEFLKTYRAVAQYNGFEGVLYTFEKMPPKERPDGAV